MDRRITIPKDSNVCSNDKRNYHPTLKGSNVYRVYVDDFYATLKGSNVYRKLFSGVYTTPSGSHVLYPDVFYKHPIPSGLFESMEADIQKGLKELKELMQ